MEIVAKYINAANFWSPFVIQPRPEKMRALHSEHGVGDRLRAVAFAEIQARDGFLWGANFFTTAPKQWRTAWLRFAEMEDQHAQLLLDRAAALGVSLGERAVSDSLLKMFHKADRPEVFYYSISTAEQRGMEVGLSMIEPMKEVDPVSAAIFERCALEEEEHIATASKHLHDFDLEALREVVRRPAGTQASVTTESVPARANH